ncbi:hypothetical protein E4U54_003765 [Claviceps lovelessii]|nr:hypothetical protein E4U54_003765 [Claviceps lovelessii]
MQFLSVLILSLSGLAMANPLPDNAAKPEAAAVKPNVITPMGVRGQNSNARMRLPSLNTPLAFMPRGSSRNGQALVHRDGFGCQMGRRMVMGLPVWSLAWATDQRYVMDLQG